MLSKEVKNEDSNPGADEKRDDKRRFNTPKKQPHRGAKFEGRCEDLKGHVYDYGDSRNADQFVLTTKEIKNYVGRTYKNGGDITSAITLLALPTKVEPADPDDPDDRVALKKWEREYDAFCKWKKVLDDNVKTLYNLVWGQCSESMQQKIESLPTFETMEANNDGIALLVAIKNTSYDYQSQKYRIESINDALYKLMTLRQGPHNTPNQYFEQFTNQMAVYVHCGGSIEPDPGCLEYVANAKGWDLTTITAEQKAIAREMGWTNLFILHADRGRYSSLITGLQNDYLTGNNN
jgi:hypothetical protein